MIVLDFNKQKHITVPIFFGHLKLQQIRHPLFPIMNDELWRNDKMRKRLTLKQSYGVGYTMYHDWMNQIG